MADWQPSMDGAPPTEALWTSRRGIEYRKHEGRWRRYVTPGHWNGSMTLSSLDDEILDALMSALGAKEGDHDAG
jgi:hypothetical protein